MSGRKYAGKIVEDFQIEHTARGWQRPEIGEPTGPRESQFGANAEDCGYAGLKDEANFSITERITGSLAWSPPLLSFSLDGVTEPPL